MRLRFSARVYRTQDFEPWSTNAPRYARQLVDKGVLVQVAQGLFAYPKRGKFGVVPPGDDALMRAFLKDGPLDEALETIRAWLERTPLPR